MGFFLKDRTCHKDFVLILFVSVKLYLAGFVSISPIYTVYFKRQLNNYSKRTAFLNLAKEYFILKMNDFVFNI